jgi:hypothetical protein
LHSGYEGSIRRSLDPKAKVVSGAVRAADCAQTAAARQNCGNANTNGLFSFLSLPGRLPREVRCIVAVIDRRAIEATAKPQSFQAPYADIELEE